MTPSSTTPKSTNLSSGTPPQLSQERSFIEHLARLERGPLAVLRRSLSDDRPGDSAQFLEGVILRSGLTHGPRQAKYMIAGLFALIERPHDEKPDEKIVEKIDDDTDEETSARPQREGKSLGYLLGTLYREQQARPSTEKRFLALLDADGEALPYQLRQAVALLKGSDVKPDWALLLRDVSSWEHEQWGNEVRRRWANHFYQAAAYQTRNTDQTDTPEELTQEATR